MKRDSESRYRLLGRGVLLAFLAISILGAGGLCFGGEQAHAPDSPRLYGFMVDPPRTPESVQYYRRLIDFSADWGMNALIFRLTDDQGVAIRLESHPELITHKNALTREEVRELVRYAQHRGIDLIPEVESFGHSKCITDVKQYADLADVDPKNPDKRNASFDSLKPNHPRVLHLMEDIYREVASLFPSRFLHGGCDEVSWGGSEFSRQALLTKTRSEIWAQYINSLDALARKAGKEFIIWGDHPLRVDPQILGLLNKDIIIMDWNYDSTDPVAVGKTAGTVLASGLKIIGAPALIWCKWGPRPGSEQLRNIDAFADAYRRIDDPRCLGVIVTNWIPSRYLQGSLWDGIAYAAVSIREGSATARETAFQCFVEKHYGAVWNDTWADIFRSYYDLTPTRKRCGPAWAWPKLPVPWHNEQELVSALKEGTVNVPPFARVLSQLTLCEPLVRKNFQDLRSFRLSIEYLDEVFWRNAVLAREARNPETHKESAEALTQAIAGRDRKLLDALKADWDEGRPSDSPIKSQITYQPEDRLVSRFAEAASFSSELANDPDRFFALLREAKAGMGSGQHAAATPAGGCPSDSK